MLGASPTTILAAPVCQGSALGPAST
jgi:hypothetical protein